MNFKTKYSHGGPLINEKQIKSFNENVIKAKLTELNTCKKSIAKLKKEDISPMSKTELYHHDRMLNMQMMKRQALLQVLSKLGYNADRRGRPRKKENETYKSTHTRMTCYFSEENIKLLKNLKEQGIIENVSSFLNELLESYFSSTNDSTNKGN